MFVYVLIPVILLLIALADEVLNERSRKALFVLTWIVLLLAAACRERYLDADHGVYLKLLSNAPSWHLLFSAPLSYIKGMTSEISFSALASFVNQYLGGDIRYIMVIYAVIGVSIKLFAIRKLTEFYFTAILIYACNFYLLHEITQIRAGVATGFLLLSLPHIINKDFNKFLLMMAIACFFHYSAIFGLVLYFIRTDKIDITLWVSLIAIALVLYVTTYDIITLMQKVNIPIFSEKVSTYVAMQQKMNVHINVLNVFILVQMILSALIYYFRNELMEQNKYTILMLKMNLLSQFCFYCFGSIPVFAFRLNEFFGVVQIILIPTLIYTCKPRSLATLIAGFVGFGLLYINLFHNMLLSRN